MVPPQAFFLYTNSLALNKIDTFSLTELIIYRYSLMEKGQTLAVRCSEFDYAVQNLTQSASIPTIPVMAGRFVSFPNSEKFCFSLFIIHSLFTSCLAL